MKDKNISIALGRECIGITYIDYDPDKIKIPAPRHESTNTTNGRQKCEHIVKAGILEKYDGSPVTWRDVWEYSPTGELYMIQVWYDMACDKIGPPERN